jgi:hypothetical protein
MVLEVFKSLKVDIKSELRNHTIEGDIESTMVNDTIKSVTVIVDIIGTFKKGALNIAKRSGFKVVDTNQIRMKASGGVRKVYNTLHKKWEVFFNTIQKESGRNYRVKEKRV